MTADLQNRDIMVVGASNGGIEATRHLLSRLPSDLPASIFLVQHTWSNSPNQLAKIMEPHTELSVVPAANDEEFTAGVVYVAPPDHHLLIEDGRTWLSRGPRENRTRPAVDPLFRSAAVAYGPRVIGVILSGALDDGTAGLDAVKRCGGLALVQDPSDAIDPQMPMNAAEAVAVDFQLPIDELGRMLARLCREPAGKPCEIPDELRAEVRIVGRETGGISANEGLGELVPMSCPECGGPLWEMRDKIARFRCHTGHAFTARTLVSGLSEAAEESLWVALRTLEERERMLRRIASKQKDRPKRMTPDPYEVKADEARQHIDQLKMLLADHQQADQYSPANTADA